MATVKTVRQNENLYLKVALCVLVIGLSGCYRLNLALQRQLSKSQPSVTPSPTPAPTPLPAWAAGVRYYTTLDNAAGSAVSSSGDIYFSGYARSNNALGIAKFDSNGTFLWETTSTFTSTTSRTLSQVVIDSTGNVYAIGTRFSGSDFYGVVLKLSTSGALIWEQEYGPFASQFEMYGLAVTSGDDILITGSTSLALNGQSPAGLTDAFLMKVTANGTPLWTTLLGASSKDTQGLSIDVSSTGEIFISGMTSAGLGGNPTPTSGHTNAYVAKFTSTGSLSWVQQMGTFGGPTHQVSFHNVREHGGDLIVSGMTQGGFNGNSQIGAIDLIVAKLDSSGTLVWAREFGSASNSTLVTDLEVDSNGNIYSAGYTNGSFAGASPSGALDGYLLKLSPTGTTTWSQMIGAASAVSTSDGIALDPEGSPYLTGTATHNFDSAVALSGTTSVLMKYTPSGVRY